MTVIRPWITRTRRFIDNISINSSFHNYTWKKHDIYLIDTPGDDNFLNETLFATHVCDSALFVVGAVLGVKGQTIKFANMVAERNLPSMIVINKMDRERADFSRTLDEIRASLPSNLLSCICRSGPRTTSRVLWTSFPARPICLMRAIKAP